MFVLKIIFYFIISLSLNYNGYYCYDFKAIVDDWGIVVECIGDSITFGVGASGKYFAIKILILILIIIIFTLNILPILYFRFK